MQENFRRSLKFRMNSYLKNFKRESIWIDIYLDFFENRESAAQNIGTQQQIHTLYA
ncbi:hypothetical protein C0J52_16226 [Blattella germanica]|nr:hypothetical protein C0J52_16226 [Blattella germanica]